MVCNIKRLTASWTYDAVSIRYPGPVLHDHILREPHNLAPGWVNFNFSKALSCPVKVINDAAMQALGSYKNGRMLFLGLGTGLGSAMIVDGLLQPMELGHLPYRDATYEDYVGVRGFRRFGKKKWRKYVADVVERLATAPKPNDIVLAGGNVKCLKELSRQRRERTNANAFTGGTRLWASRLASESQAAYDHLSGKRATATAGS